MGRPRSRPLPAGIYARRLASGVESYSISFEASGGRVRENAGMSVEEAVRLRALRLRQVAEGTYSKDASGTDTLASYGAAWFEKRRKAGKVRSVEGEWRLWRDYIEPHLGAKRLDEIRPRHVAAWVDELVRSSGLAPKSIITTHGVLSVALGRARFEEVILDNPAKGLPPGTLPEPIAVREVAPWTRDEMIALSTDARIREDRRTIYAIASFTGARCGEVAGLRWRDLETKARPLWLWRLRTQGDGLPLKTGRPRAVPIHPELQRLLETWKSEGFPRFMGRHARPDDFVVPREDGRCHTDASCGAKAVRRHAASIGIDTTARDFHSFRRGFVTVARTDGAPVDLVERITHNAKGEQIDGYTYFGFAALCDAVLAVRMTIETAAVLPMRRAVGDSPGHALGHAPEAALASTLISGSEEWRRVESNRAADAAGRGFQRRTAAIGSSRSLSPTPQDPRGSAIVPARVPRVTREEAVAALGRLADVLDEDGAAIVRDAAARLRR